MPEQSVHVEVTPALLERIAAGSNRLYEQSFLGRSWLADYVADVDTLCMAYERRCNCGYSDLHAALARLDAAVPAEEKQG